MAQDTHLALDTLWITKVACLRQQSLSIRHLQTALIDNVSATHSSVQPKIT